MKPYSVRRMRKECQPIFRVLIGEAVVNLFFAAFFGAMWKVMEEGEDMTSLIFSGVFLVIFLFMMGVYLVVSDTKWMTKHTLFGKTLAGLGIAERLMEQIDKEAETMDYECGRFALMAHWLVLYQSAPLKTWGNAQIQSRPIPVGHLLRIRWNKDTDEENAGYWVCVGTLDGAEYELFVWENTDIEALRQWGEAKEQRA